MKLLIILLIISSNSFAANCSYEIKKQDFKVEWVAFKTPLKVGVKGSFDKLGVTKNAKAKSIKKLLSGINFNIDGKSVNSNNKDRDLKLYKSFFALFGAKMSGKLVSYKKSILNMELTINGVKKIIPLKANLDNSTLTAAGVIDVLDFKLGASLASINKACLELHEGKTWNDVEVKLTAKYLKTCK